MKEYKHRCAAQVPSDSRWPSYFPCTREGSVERDGKWYCKTHDPVAIIEKSKVKQAKWDAEWDKKRAGWNRQKAEVKACEGIPTKALEEGVIQEMIEVCENLASKDPFAMGIAETEASKILAKLAEKEE